MEDRKKRILNIAIIILAIIIVSELALYFSMKQETEKQKEIKYYHGPKFFSTENATLVTLKLPAVDSEGNGVTTTLVVEAVPGTGRTLVDIDNILFWADTQHSIRMARLVAGNITGKNLSHYDLVYSIHAPASIIGGPSAGAAITIATIAALEGKKPRDDVMITGTINHDGTIGPVSAILEKAEAAKQANATIFLVPLLQSKDVVYETSQHCETFGNARICTTETRPKKISVGEKVGIEVIEVGDVREAMQYFFGNRE